MASHFLVASLCPKKNLKDFILPTNLLDSLEVESSPRLEVISLGVLKVFLYFPGSVSVFEAWRFTPFLHTLVLLARFFFSPSLGV